MEKPRFLNAERVLFALLACVLGACAWRAGLLAPLHPMLDPRKPLAPMPGPARHKEVEGAAFSDPAGALESIKTDTFWGHDRRSPFEPPSGPPRVVAAKVSALFRIRGPAGTADVNINYRIMPDPVSKFEFWLPAHVSPVSVKGANMASPNRPEVAPKGSGKLYTVKLTWPAYDRYDLRLRLKWKEPQGPLAQIPKLLLPNVTEGKERGLLVVAAPEREDVFVKATEKLAAYPTDKLPPELAAQGCIAAYTYRSPYAIELGIRPKIVTYRPRVKPKERPVVKKPRALDLPKNPFVVKKPKRPPVKKTPTKKIFRRAFIRPSGAASFMRNKNTRTL